ncbi:MAG: TldD/PmbA family protein [Rhodospirillaceae bacterium]|nr:TldD/PmbA family protein [Rhodospirillaceae bacterium]MCY4239402.1 TldD/PmbA family protein [Rhodospirillaceae bacterium]MCY4312019.1 TldD/PmbA family protein [Rhodospirillaceae bacterium]
MSDSLSQLGDLLKAAISVGADAADAVYVEGEAISHTQRLGNLEMIERSEGQDLGLRVFVGRRQASVSAQKVDFRDFGALASRAVAMARAVPEDLYCGIADPDQIAMTPPVFEMADETEPPEKLLIERARAAEDAARTVKGVTNSEGAEASWSRTAVTLATTNGFEGKYWRTAHSVSVSVVAGSGADMQTDYDHHTTVFSDDLMDPAEIGQSAGERAVARLGARSIKTIKAPVVFSKRVAGSLLGHLLNAINGSSIARGTSFLKDALEKPVMASDLNVTDDPHKPRGLRSKPFDGEGVPTARRKLIDNGVLTTWLLDLRSARQLGLTPTGHASRGTSGPPFPSAANVFLEPGSVSRNALIGGIKEGLYVTEIIGMGVNGVTGDYSRGAGGYWIRNGELAFPVTELTIAGNLKDMFRTITPASDLEFRHGVDAPTLRVDSMTIAGTQGG